MVLAATLEQRAAQRYTPAGLPALDVELKHESTLSEDGQARKVALQLKAVAIGQVTKAVQALKLGEGALFSGFIASARNGRGLVFHITAVDPSLKEPVHEPGLLPTPIK